MNEHVTLMHPVARDATARAISSGFPVDLLNQSAGRLRLPALLHASVFCMAGIFPALLSPAARAGFFGSFVQWGPAVIGIVVALLVAAVIRSPRLPLPTAMNLGLAFEIASSYAIAAAEFADPMGLEMHSGFMGLSWVAVWVVLFTVVVPTAPRRALLAALASVSSVPVVIGLLIASGTTSLRIAPAQFFFGLVFPYLLVVGMAYVGARVVYYLGTEVMNHTGDRKSTRLNSSHGYISYAVFCLKKKKNNALHATTCDRPELIGTVTAKPTTRKICSNLQRRKHNATVAACRSANHRVLEFETVTQ